MNIYEKELDRIDIGKNSSSVQAVRIKVILSKLFSLAQTTHLLIKIYNINSAILKHRKQKEITHAFKFVTGERESC